MAINPINPLLYIKDIPIRDEIALDASGWFKTETMEMNFGESIGRPDENVVFRTSTLTYLLANGWYIDAVLRSASGGHWESVASVQASGESSNSASSSNTSQSTSTSESRSHSHVRASNTTEYSVNSAGDRTRSYSVGYTDTENNGNGTATSQNEGANNSTNSSNNSSSSATVSSGSPYWYAYQCIRLKRRKLQAELVLKDMINEFTKAYNEGRQVNDQRYDELVQLYALMLSRTESELGSIDLSTENVKPLVDQVLETCKVAMDRFEDRVGDLPEVWQQSRVEEIDRKFDAQLAAEKSKLISAGLYNGTVWTTVAAGIERERQIAQNQLNDVMVLTKIEAYGKIPALTAEIGGKIADASTRFASLQKELLAPTELRNAVFLKMLEFMERRDDDYPNLDQVAGVAANLGFSEGASMGGA